MISLAPEAPFYYDGLTLIPASMSKNMPCKLSVEITNPFQTATFEFWKEISISITRFIMDVITYSC